MYIFTLLLLCCQFFSSPLPFFWCLHFCWLPTTIAHILNGYILIHSKIKLLCSWFLLVAASQFLLLACFIFGIIVSTFFLILFMPLLSFSFLFFCTWTISLKNKLEFLPILLLFLFVLDYWFFPSSLICFGANFFSSLNFSFYLLFLAHSQISFLLVDRQCNYCIWKHSVRKVKH